MPINTTTPEKSILTVSQLNRRAKQLLETHLPLIWVSGEISNFAQPASGHWYFSLKDKQAQVRCAMFRNANQRLRWQPESGQQVLIRARVSLYEGRGEYQLIAEHMEPAGAGLLQQAYEALKNQLQAEGLFDADRKQALPSFPQHIGVITSPTGAAIHDILSVLARRYPIAEVSILPVSVQGETAATEMIHAIQKAHQLKAPRFKPFDVLIIGRGGGSLEDLWAFNDEQLARTIAASTIPIVSAVGHEVDFTIADFVADERAPTPSVSAEMISPDISDWMQTFDYYRESLKNHLQRKINQQKQRLQFLQKRLRHPSEKLTNQQKQLNYLQQTLVSSMRVYLNQQKTLIKQTDARLTQQHPQKIISLHTASLSKLHERLHRSIGITLTNKQQTLSSAANLLDAVSPLSVLSRGYSIASQKDGTIIKNTSQIKSGDEITTQLSEGSFTSIVTTCPLKK